MTSPEECGRGRQGHLFPTACSACRCVWPDCLSEHAKRNVDAFVDGTLASWTKREAS